MLDKNWQDAVLGSVALPDPLENSERSDIGNVVDAFLKNPGGWSRQEVEEFVNTALQNDAGEMFFNHSEGLAQLDDWEQHMLDSQGESEQVVATARARRESLDSEYEQRRHQLADTVTGLRGARAVPLHEDTCAWMVKLDQDGCMSQRMAVDVATVFATQASTAIDPALEPADPQLPDVGMGLDSITASYDQEAARSARAQRVSPSTRLASTTTTDLRRTMEKTRYASNERRTEIHRDLRPDLSRPMVRREPQREVGERENTRSAAAPQRESREPVTAGEALNETVQQLRERSAKQFSNAASKRSTTTKRSDKSDDFSPEI